MIMAYILLALSLSHLTWILTESYLLAPYRRWVASIHPALDYSSTCSMCTSTQLALLLAWVCPPIWPAGYGVGYVLTALLVAKLAIIAGDLSQWLLNQVYQTIEPVSSQVSDPLQGTTDVSP